MLVSPLQRNSMMEDCWNIFSVEEDSIFHPDRSVGSGECFYWLRSITSDQQFAKFFLSILWSARIVWKVWSKCFYSIICILKLGTHKRFLLRREKAPATHDPSNVCLSKLFRAKLWNFWLIEILYLVIISYLLTSPKAIDDIKFKISFSALNFGLTFGDASLIQCEIKKYGRRSTRQGR